MCVVVCLAALCAILSAVPAVRLHLRIWWHISRAGLPSGEWFEESVEVLGSEIGRPAIPALILALQIPDGFLFYEGLGSSALHRIGAGDEMIQYLAHKSPKVRVVAASVICWAGTREAQPQLRELLEDPDLLVRAAAAMALARFGDHTAESALIGGLSDLETLGPAVYWLGELKSRRAVEPLRKRLGQLRQQEWYAQPILAALQKICGGPGVAGSAGSGAEFQSAIDDWEAWWAERQQRIRRDPD